MNQGLLYEPRSFWSIAYPDGVGQGGVFEMDRRHFYNGEKWPITIKRLVVCAINYSYMQGQTILGPGQEGSSNLSTIEVGISVPQRYHLNTKRLVQAASVAPRPTWTPRAQTPVAGSPSSLWGQCMLKPDNPLYIPRMGSIEWALSSFTPWSGQQTSQTEQAHASLLYQEEGGLLPGSARTFDFDLNFMDTQALVQLLANLGTLDNTGENPLPESWPYYPDATSLGGTPIVGGTPQFWPPQQNFNTKIFDEQESTRSGTTKITDLRTFIDQRAYDDELRNSEFPDAAPSPLSMRVGTRIRTTNSGSKTWWWRPGAPLALVFDHITPANVYELPEWITLRPGEQIDVEVRFPTGQTRLRNVGLSLNGFAAIEG